MVEYRNLQGSTDYSSGLDQVEDLVALTDSGGRLYLSVRPKGSGNNYFKYLMFFEAAMVYINEDGTK